MGSPKPEGKELQIISGAGNGDSRKRKAENFRQSVGQEMEIAENGNTDEGYGN